MRVGVGDRAFKSFAAEHDDEAMFLARLDDDLGVAENEFLTLLVTQLKNQDPLSPLQPHEFAAQLAQFTSVEQLEQVNAGLRSMNDASGLATLVGKTTFGATLIGKHVVAAGDRLVVPSSGSVSVRVEVGAGGGAAILRLRDENGREVAKRELGSLGAGRQTITLPPDVPPGTWRYVIDVTGADGKAIPVQTYSSGNVQGVFFRNGQIFLGLGGVEVALDDVTEIESTK